MLKFGMSDYEVNQNIPGVIIGNLLVYGAVIGATLAVLGVVVVTGVIKVFS